MIPRLCRLAGLSSMPLLSLLGGTMALGVGVVQAADPLQLESVAPQVVVSEETHSLTITGSGFSPETQFTLVGGGVYETGITPWTVSIAGFSMERDGDLLYATGYDLYAPDGLRYALSVVDIQDPDSPVLLARTESGCAGDLALAGHHAYIIDGPRGLGWTLCIVDVADPLHPALISWQQLPCPAQDLAASPHALYLACYTGDVLVMDLADPEHPLPSSSLPDLSAWGYFGVAVQDDLLNVADQYFGLTTFSIADPLLPLLLGREPIATGLNVTTVGHRAYVSGPGLYGDQLQVVDSADPKHPRLEGATGLFSGQRFAGQDDFAFASNGKYLWVYDVRDPRQPAALYGQNFGGFYPYEHDFVGDLEVTRSGDRLVVADGSNKRLQTFDVSRPVPPGLVQQVRGMGQVRAGVVAGDRAYLGNWEYGTSIVDLAEPGRPKPLGCLPEYDVKAAAGDLAFAARGRELIIWDVRNPRRPSRLGAMTVPASISDIAAAGSIAYVGLDWNGHARDGRVLVIDVSIPSMPEVIGEIPPEEQGRYLDIAPWSLRLTGDLLVFRRHESYHLTVQIVDVSNPAAPRPLGLYTDPDISDNGGDLALDGTYIYLATFQGLRILDMSDPTAPSLAGSLAGHDVQHVVLDGHAAFLIGPRGETVADISDPTHPRLAGGSPWRSDIAEVRDGFAYHAGSVSGLQVIRVNPLLPPAVMGAPGEATLHVPAGMAPGFYHVKALNPGGEEAFLHNAVEVTGEAPPVQPLRPGRNRHTCPSI